jgi:hypothetical protein
MRAKPRGVLRRNEGSSLVVKSDSLQHYINIFGEAITEANRALWLNVRHDTRAIFARFMMLGVSFDVLPVFVDLVHMCGLNGLVCGRRIHLHRKPPNPIRDRMRAF